ncbi:MAG TPA: hypothetical protein VGR00_03570, partial [Thermoanaerobaculia bacterium]|nr:hypothetical protein [Thermoanaerobaculia bacterium]
MKISLEKSASRALVAALAIGLVAISGESLAQAPAAAAGCADKPEVRVLVWAWNAQMGAMLATGGPQAVKGSLMCKNGVNLKLIRQDDSGKMQESLVAFATQLAKTPNPTDGAHFVVIMGDGAAAFLKGLNDALKRLGPEYTAKVIASL